MQVLILSAVTLLLQGAASLRADDCACKVITPTDQEIAVLDSNNQDAAKAGFEKLIKKHFDLDATKDPQLIEPFSPISTPAAPEVKAPSAPAALFCHIIPSPGVASPAKPALTEPKVPSPTAAVDNACAPAPSGENAATHGAAVVKAVESFTAALKAGSAAPPVNQIPHIPLSQYIDVAPSAANVQASPDTEASGNECSSTEAPPTESPQVSSAYTQLYNASPVPEAHASIQLYQATGPRPDVAEKPACELQSSSQQETPEEPAQETTEQPPEDYTAAPQQEYTQAPSQEYTQEPQQEYASEPPQQSSQDPPQEPETYTSAPEHIPEGVYLNAKRSEGDTSAQPKQVDHHSVPYGAYYPSFASISSYRSRRYAPFPTCGCCSSVQNFVPPVAVASAPDVSYSLPPGPPSRIQDVVCSLNERRSTDGNEEFTTSGCLPDADRIIIPQEEKLVRQLPIVNKVLRNVVEFVTRHVPVVRHRNRTVEETYTIQVPITENITTTVVDSVLKKVPVLFIRQKPVIHKTIRQVPVVETRYRPVEQITITNVPVRQRVIKNVVDFNIRPNPYPCGTPSLYAAAVPSVVPVVPIACPSCSPCTSSVIASTVVRR